MGKLLGLENESELSPITQALIRTNLESFPMFEMISNLTIKYFFIVQFNDAILFNSTMET
jgi:hypothetical protein